MLLELNIVKDVETKVLCDNTSAIRITQSEICTPRTLHLRAKNSFVEELVELKKINIQHVNTSEPNCRFLNKTNANKKIYSKQE